MILAVDTSCYTTSMCLTHVNTGRILHELNILLKVKPGERGLRQSEGFFQHVNQLSSSFEAFCLNFDMRELKAVVVSSRPRPVEGSYMPVFNAGLLFCMNLANALRIPLYQTSHQEGHLMAAIKTCGLEHTPQHFYGLHLSGGTTEILEATKSDDGFEVELLGGTLDLNFGQLIDRIGLELGFDFPCGRMMDEHAQNDSHSAYFKVNLKNALAFNLSGLENKYKAIINDYPIEYICKHLFNTIAHIINEILTTLPKDLPIILSGGVASNAIVKAYLIRTLSERAIYFAMPDYSRDNAYGVSELGRQKYIKEYVV